MTGMEGRHGILKSDFNAQALRVSAASVRPLTAHYSPLQPLRPRGTAPQRSVIKGWY